METSLHRQLKALYAGPNGACEVRLGRHRIDAVRRGRLIEIQHASLASIRRKVADLLSSHKVTIVKPIVADKYVVQLDGQGGRIVTRRLSPKHGTWLDAFHELVYFTGQFPHPRLSIEFVLVTIEETRYPGHGRRRRWRARDHVVADQKLLEIRETRRIGRASDLWKLLSAAPPSPFDSGQLATALACPRWIAQRIAYCLRHAGAVRETGKRGNARVYEIAPAPRGKTAARRKTAA